MYVGSIIKLNILRGFGFISCPNMADDIFFHVGDIAPPLEFDESLQERRVRFSVQSSPKGPRAVDIAPAE